MQRRRGIPGVVAAGSLVAAAAVRRSVTRFEIADRSMSPALLPGDFVLAVRPRRQLRRGSIVVFAHPDRPDFDLVKRVVGLPGERVEISRGTVAVQGRVLAEAWADGATFPDGSWRLGPREAFVLGDRRAESADDSRMIGPVAVGSIGWVVVARYWPLRSGGRVGAAG